MKFPRFLRGLSRDRPVTFGLGVALLVGGWGMLRLAHDEVIDFPTVPVDPDYTYKKEVERLMQELLWTEDLVLTSDTPEPEALTKLIPIPPLSPEEFKSSVAKQILRNRFRRSKAGERTPSAQTESYWRMRVYVIGVVGMAAGAGLIGSAAMRKSE